MNAAIYILQNPNLLMNTFAGQLPAVALFFGLAHLVLRKFITIEIRPWVALGYIVAPTFVLALLGWDIRAEKYGDGIKLLVPLVLSALFCGGLYYQEWKRQISKKLASPQVPSNGKTADIRPQSRMPNEPLPVQSQAVAPAATHVGPAPVDEDAIYTAIAQELETGSTDKGIWIRVFAECDGDENQTKARYIKERAERLITAERARLEQVWGDERIRGHRILEGTPVVPVEQSDQSTLNKSEPVAEAVQPGVSARENYRYSGVSARENYRYFAIVGAFAVLLLMGVFLSGRDSSAPTTGLGASPQPSKPPAAKNLIPEEEERLLVIDQELLKNYKPGKPGYRSLGDLCFYSNECSGSLACNINGRCFDPAKETWEGKKQNPASSKAGKNVASKAASVASPPSVQTPTSPADKALTKEDIEEKKLTAAHPDWRTIIKTQEFQYWRDSVISDGQALMKSEDVAFISRRLSEFKKWRKGRSN